MRFVGIDKTKSYLVHIRYLLVESLALAHHVGWFMVIIWCLFHIALCTTLGSILSRRIFLYNFELWYWGQNSILLHKI